MSSLGKWALPSGVVLAVTGVAVIAALGTYQSGFRYGGNTPVFVILLAVATLVSWSAAIKLAWARGRAPGRWLAATSASLLVYLASTAVAAEYAGRQGHGDALAQAAVAMHAAGYIMPIALLQVTLLAAGQRGRRIGHWMLGYAIAATVLVMMSVPVGEPYQHITPLFELPEEVSYASIPWMASVVIGPAVLWRAIPRASGQARQRLLTVAVVSIAPITTILLCLLSGGLAYTFGVMPTATAEGALSVAFCAPFILCALGMATLTRPAGTGLAHRLTPLLKVATGVLLSMVIVALSAVLGDRMHADTVFPVVVGTLVMVAVFLPLQRRLARALTLRLDPGRARAARLVREAGSPDRPGATAQDILRSALDDPAATLVLRLPDGRGWVYAGGGAAPERPAASISISDDAYLVYDGDPADAEGAIAEVGVLVGQAVLEVAVREQSERAETAAALERRRLERDLHDGVQGRLLALALDLRMAQRRLTDTDAQLVLTDATESLSAAIDELRSLATGNAPESLSRHGLGVALVELASRMPVPVRLNVPQQRLPPQVEIVAYLVVCEAVTNALKHAQASEVTVDMSVGDGRADLAVTDDGRGGADLRAGAGLRGLSERVRTAGGHLVVSDRRPHGTRLEVSLPCE